MNENYIRRFAEPLSGGRAELHEDVVIDGKLEMSYPIGSPAPIATVEKHETKFNLE